MSLATVNRKGTILIRLIMKWFYGQSPSADSRWVGVSYKLKYVQEVLVAMSSLLRKKCG